MSVTFSKRFIYAQAIFWGCSFLVGFVFLAIQLFKEYERAPYEKYIGNYLEKPQNNLSERLSVPKESVAINGKLVVVNLKDKKMDPIFNDLPINLKPQNPDQVKTILWIECSPVLAFLKYADGTTAFNNVCTLTFIDFLNKKYLWKDTLNVSPPSTKSRGTEAHVSDPSDTILSYLKSVPHKE